MKRSLKLTLTTRPNSIDYTIITNGNVTGEEMDNAITTIGGSRFVDGLIAQIRHGEMGPWRVSSVTYTVEE